MHFRSWHVACTQACNSRLSFESSGSTVLFMSSPQFSYFLQAKWWICIPWIQKQCLCVQNTVIYSIGQDFSESYFMYVVLWSFLKKETQRECSEFQSNFFSFGNTLRWNVATRNICGMVWQFFSMHDLAGRQRSFSFPSRREAGGQFENIRRCGITLILKYGIHV